MSETLKGGNEWNTLRAYSPNMLCFCGSMKKFKKCHRDRLPRQVRMGDHRSARGERLSWFQRMKREIKLILRGM